MSSHKMSRILDSFVKVCVKLDELRFKDTTDWGDLAINIHNNAKERGYMKITVQKICKYAKDENKVREILEALWKESEKDAEILAEVTSRNKELYELQYFSLYLSKYKKGRLNKKLSEGLLWSI